MSFRLGIDVGTTTVKVSLMDDTDDTDTFSAKLQHDAYVINEANDSTGQMHREQEAKVLIGALDKCLMKLVPLSCSNSSGNVASVSVTGQMHGVILWRKAHKRTEKKNIDCLLTLFEDTVGECSNLITWEDQRCDEQFISTLPQDPFDSIATGYGVASLLWLRRHRHEYLQSFDMCGTIMDFVVWLLTQTEHVTMSTHNAKSWGYFNADQMCWQFDKFSVMQFDTSILPVVLEPGSSVGVSVVSCHGITKSITTIEVGLGDMQCSIRSCDPKHDEAVLNMGTSSQLSVIVNKNMISDMDRFKKNYPTLTVVPYSSDDVIITAASLSGGNVLQHFANVLRDWMTELRCQSIPDVCHILKIFEVTAKNDSQSQNDDIIITPNLFGERHSPNKFATVSNLSARNTSLGSVTRAIYKGLVSNLLSMFSKQLLDSCNVSRIVVTGGTVVNNQLLKELIKNIFELPLRISDQYDAASGSIIFKRSPTHRT